MTLVECFKGKYNDNELLNRGFGYIRVLVLGKNTGEGHLARGLTGLTGRQYDV